MVLDETREPMTKRDSKIQVWASLVLIARGSQAQDWLQRIKVLNYCVHVRRGV